MQLLRLAAVVSLAPLAWSQNAPGGFDLPLHFRDLDETQPQRLTAAGDMDGDGDADLAALLAFSFSGESELRIYRSDDDLKFTLRQTLDVPFVNNADTGRTLIGDMTGDGFPELVVIRENFVFGAYTRVFVNLGTVQYAPQLDPGFHSSLTQLADREGDGVLEMAVPSFDASGLVIEWYGFDAQGVFGLEAVDTLAGVTFFRIAPLDADGDGDSDFVVYRAGSNTLELVINGPSGLIAGSIHPLSDTILSLDRTALLTGDIDGNGGEDAIFVDTQPFSPTTLFPLANDGSGNFALEPAYEIPEEPSTFEFARNDLVDWDGDGDLDWIAEVGDPLFLENVGGFTFEGLGEVTTTGSFGAGAADVDGDGDFDWLGGNDIVLGDGDMPEIPFVNLVEALALDDVDHDGDTDLVGVNGIVAANFGASAFAIVGSFPLAPPGFTYGSTVAHGDFNGDGFADFIVEVFQSGGGLASMGLVAVDAVGNYANVVNATPAFVGIPDSGDGLLWPSADMDGDGTLDIAARSSVWTNDGDGDFVEVAGTHTGSARLVADLVGDGQPDIVAVDIDQLRLHENQGELIFGSTTLGAGALESGSDFASIVHAMDLDLDGDLDLVESDRSDEISLYENDGTGSFGPATLLTTPWEFVRGAVGAEDIDEDGDAELMAVFFEDDFSDDRFRLGVWEAAHGGGYTLDQEWFVQVVSSFNYPRNHFVDHDQDGDLDLIGNIIGRNLRYEGAEGGVIREYGEGVPGAGGGVPIASAQGPARVGSGTMELRFVRMVGGAPGVLLIGFDEVALPDVPLPGMTLYAADTVVLLSFVASGAGGAPGEGTFTIPVDVLPGLVGVPFYHQVFAFDGEAAEGLSASNGLEVIYGP